MDSLEILLLVAVGLFCGGLNAIVGGGTLICFPVLLSLGLPPVMANATNTLGLLPASLVAAHTYTPELRKAGPRLLSRCVIVTVGGIVGAFLLIASGDALFFQFVPWLIAAATLLFGFSRRIVRRVSRLGARGGLVLSGVLEFLFGIYGGYFGAAIGILFMATLMLGGEHDAQVANAQKNLFGGLVNTAAAVIFVVQGAVVWSVCLALVAGSVIGGRLGAAVARIIPAEWLRAGVLAAGAILSAVYFQQVYWP